MNAKWLRAELALGLIVTPAAAYAQTDPSAFTSATRYDASRRPTGTIAPDPDGDGPLRYAATRTTYDGSGNATRIESGELSSWQPEAVAPVSWTGFTISRQIDISYDANHRKLTETTSSGGTIYALTQFSYDADGRLDCTAVRMNLNAALPATACLQPSGSGVTDIDRITRNFYDPAGQLLRVQKAYGTPLQQDYVTYTYSADGKPLTVKDANGNLAGYTYDGFDRLVAWAFPSKTTTGAVAACTLGSVVESNDAFGVPVSGLNGAATAGDDCEKYHYDRNGNRARLMKRDGRVFTYNYDALNRVTVKTVPGACVVGFACTAPPASAVRDVYYGYNLQGLQLYARFDSPGGVDSVDNLYDGFGRLSSQTTSMYGVSRTVRYRYDADGNRVRITHPDGVYFTTDYDGLDRATAVMENGTTTIASMAYNSDGRLASETRGPVTTALDYDGASRLFSLADDLPGGTDNDLKTTLDYSPANQLISRKRSNPSPYAFTRYINVTRTYETNGLNQYSSSASTLNGTTMASETYDYDSNGNLVSDGTTGYTYDSENRLVGSTTGYLLAYDPLGRLYGFNGSAGKSVAYDGDQRIIDYSADPSIVRARYVLGQGTDHPLVWYAGAALNDRRSLQSDERGSIVSAVDASGGLVGINSYDEYGIPAASNVGTYGYTGQVWVTTMGMWYYKARFYSPTLGRFMQTDPIGYKDQLNLYLYVANDPLNKTDPSGTKSEVICRPVKLGPYEGANHCFVVVTGEDGKVERRFSYGPQREGIGDWGNLVETAGDSKSDTDRGDEAATNNPALRTNTINLNKLGYKDSSVLEAGAKVDKMVGYGNRPGKTGYFPLPNGFKRGWANSNAGMMRVLRESKPPGVSVSITLKGWTPGMEASGQVGQEQEEFWTANPQLPGGGP